MYINKDFSRSRNRNLVLVITSSSSSLSLSSSSSPSVKSPSSLSSSSSSASASSSSSSLAGSPFSCFSCFFFLNRLACEHLFDLINLIYIFLKKENIMSAIFCQFSFYLFVVAITLLPSLGLYRIQFAISCTALLLRAL